MPISSEVLARAREAQEEWRDAGLRHRLDCLRLARHRFADAARELAEACGRDNVAESLNAEVLTLVDSCKFLERRASEVLAPRTLKKGRPLWMGKVESVVHREPRGVVLVVGPGNYPLTLPGVQALHALAAGNAVVIKPSPNGVKAMQVFVRKLSMSDGLVQVLAPDPAEATAAIRSGVDHVVLTGSAATGRAVLAETNARLTTSTMELSGCDAAFVLEGADVARAAKAVAFGLMLNGGCTCIAPRRVFVAQSLAGEFESALRVRLQSAAGSSGGRQCNEMSEAVVLKVRELLSGSGARVVCGGFESERLKPLVLGGMDAADPRANQDLFAPVSFLFEFEAMEEALEKAGHCPYRLGATVFGPEKAARQFAELVDAGTVVINDIIVPTADPRAPFGGRGESGFGVTRGDEGLLEMTVPKVVSVRKGNFLPHLDGSMPEDAEVFENYIAAVHGRGHGARIRAWRKLFRSLREKLQRDQARSA
ncbi:MAG: aldehyde dehydrogenase family protein [Verrucomicrobiota bacterium]